jgi:hypothetical protein
MGFSVYNGMMGGVELPSASCLLETSDKIYTDCGIFLGV